MGSVATRGFGFSIFLVILGGLAWGWIAATGRNPVEGLLGKRAWLVYGAVGLAALFLLWIGRNTFLPFLGPTVFPCGLLEDKIPEGADTQLTIQTRPGAKVLFWAAEPGSEVLKNIPTWRQAYASYSNAGVTTADANGIATLQVRSPQSYTVGFKGQLAPHIHYRMCLADGGLSQIETAFLGGLEHFQEEEMPQEHQAILAEPFVDSSLPVAQPPDAESAPILPPPESAAAPVATPQSMEGFRSEPMFAPANPENSQQESLGIVGTDQRLFQVRDYVQNDSMGLFDEFAYAEGPQIQGADLGAAYSEPVRPTCSPSAAAA